MLSEDIQTALKTGNAILGYRRSIKFIKTNKPRLIVLSGNVPEQIRNEIEHVAKLSGLKLEVYDGASRDLGIVCGKPFPVSVLTIKG